MTLLPRSIGSLGGCAKHLGKNFCVAVGAVDSEVAVDNFGLANWAHSNETSLAHASRRNRQSAHVPSDPVFYPQAEWKNFNGASTAKDVGMDVSRSHGLADLASWRGGGMCGVENVPRVNTEVVNIDVLSSNLELLRRMEESVLGIRTVVLSSKRRKLDTAEGDGENDAHASRNPRTRMREICSKMGDLSDTLLVGLGKAGMANKHLKPRLFKQTLDFGYVFREKAIQNVWHYVHDLGISGEEVLRMFDRDPLFASRSFSRNVAPKIRWLESLGVDGSVVVHKWLARANRVLFRSSLGKLKENYAWLQNLGLSREECTSLLIQCPQILQKDIASLDEKLLFAIVVLGKDIYDLVRWPTYFTYSFQNRIFLRTAFCSMSDIDFKALAIPTLFGSNDSQFLLSKRSHFRGGDTSNDQLMKSYAEFKKKWAGLDVMEKFAAIGERTGEISHASQHGL
ncbi:hypothetical protein BSKO_09622 [Bryopsis sp. KO-2023]|nr:hypothetical protein BSKO_09622 [Bryopsis sp. KO-2023]